MLQEEGTACVNTLRWEGAQKMQGTEEWPLQ